MCVCHFCSGGAVAKTPSTSPAPQDPTPPSLPPPPPTLVSPFASLSVLFVDDESANCRIGMRTLKNLGVPPDRITVLNDGTAPEGGFVVCVYARVCLRSLSRIPS